MFSQALALKESGGPYRDFYKANEQRFNEYRDLKAYWDKIIAQEIADYGLAAATAENLLVVRALKRRLSNLVPTAPDGEMGLGDMPRALKTAIELELLLLGGATERHEHIVGATWMELMEAAAARAADDRLVTGLEGA